MYTIIMTEHKELLTTESEPLFQRENLADKIQFLFPHYYHGNDLRDFVVVLKYVDQANTAHTEILEKDNRLYKGKVRCVFPVDSNFSKFAGEVRFHITFIKFDVETLESVVFHTTESSITITPLADYYQFIADDSLETIDQLIAELTARLEAVDNLAESIDQNKADDLSYEDYELQLLANGNKIGSAVTIKSDSGDSGSTDKDVATDDEVKNALEQIFGEDNSLTPTDLKLVMEALYK